MMFGVILNKPTTPNLPRKIYKVVKKRFYLAFTCCRNKHTFAKLFFHLAETERFTICQGSVCIPMAMQPRKEK